MPDGGLCSEDVRPRATHVCNSRQRFFVMGYPRMEAPDFYNRIFYSSCCFWLVHRALAQRFAIQKADDKLDWLRRSFR
jgi:hypothetical protein